MKLDRHYLTQCILACTCDALFCATEFCLAVTPLAQRPPYEDDSILV